MKKKVLIVDDAIFMQKVLSDMMIDIGNEVVATASNGREALKKAKQFNPDIITLDITMPDMDGISALKELKQINPRFKILMCSAMGQKAFILRAIESGADDFVIKPFTREKIVKALKNLENS